MTSQNTRTPVDPGGRGTHLAGRMGGENWTPEMDGPGAERVIIKIVPAPVDDPPF